MFHVHQALEEVREKNGENSTIGMQYSLNQFSKQEFESKKEILKRIRVLFYEEKDIIRLALGEYRFSKFEQLLLSEPFDDSAVPQSLNSKLTAKDDFLLLMFSPADKNFFNVKILYEQNIVNKV